MPTAKTRAVRKYNEKNYERISVVVPKGQKEVITSYAKSQGMTTNGFIITLINEHISKKQK